MRISTLHLIKVLALLALLFAAKLANAQAPPGNALNFNPSAYNVVAAGTDLPAMNGNFALEAWVRTTATVPNTIVVAVSSMDNFYLGIDNYAADGHQGQALFHIGSTFISSQTRIDDGRWHHIAGTVTSNVATVYVDGVAEGTGSGYYTNYPDQGLNVGSYGPYGGSNGWPGSIDEVRVWNIARSATDIKASFNNVPTVPQAGLLVYYNFDRGTAGGNNAGVTTLPNLAGSGYTGTLSNFTLNGATSNWIESYALVQPTNLAATSTSSGTSITATWTAPPVGTITNYVLDVSTTADYSAGVTTFTPASGASSQVVSTTANTRYWLRLRADKTSVTGQATYSHDVATLRTGNGLTAPGNALAFDGGDDYVALPNSAPVPTGNGTYTLEAWIKPNLMGVMGIIGWGNWGSTNQVNALRLSPDGIVNYWWGPDLIVTTPDLSGHWHHVAATFDGTTRTIYLDGVAVGSDTPGGHAVPIPSNLRIGCTNGPGGGYEYFNGSIDEVRVWNVARTAAQIKAAYTSQPAVPQAGLVVAYDFDAGTAAGNNTTQTTLFDRTSNFQDGTLTNFDLTGGATTSNYVESYARVVPPTTVSGVTATGFTTSWTAPTVGTVSSYVFEYSLSATFASGVTTLPLAANVSSQAASGLLPNRNYYYRLRADKTSVTGTGAYASGIVRTASGQTPPGNALAFDGVDDQVNGTNALLPQGNAPRTIETWVYYNGNTNNNVLMNYGMGAANQRAALMIVGNKLYYAGEFSDLQGNAVVSANSWHHVAATYTGTTLSLYLDGVLDRSATMPAFATTGYSWRAGSRINSTSEVLNGRLDELRIYNVALTQAQVRADMVGTASAVPASLVAYYDFDQGTAGGSNAAITTLTDQTASPHDGTLTNFALTNGNATSNWVESYALVMPTLTASTGVTSTGFTANWTPSAIGSADNGYRLEVATSNSFAAPALVSGSPFTVAAGTTSQAITGLTAGQTYYLRVRADKTSVTGQGNNSFTAIQQPMPPMSPPGNALAFDGSDDYVTVPPSLALDNLGLGSFTLEAWVYCTNQTPVNSIIRKGGDYNLFLRPNGVLSLEVWSGGMGDATRPFSQTLAVVPPNRWTHVAATWNGAAIKLYVNGVDMSGTMSSSPIATAEALQIGRSAAFNETFNGRLDEVRIYNAALTQAQVQADMTSTSAAVPASLQLYYNFDHGTASGANAGYTTAADLSANLAHGTLTNFNLTSGNTTSNWVESYALLEPTSLAATPNANGTSLNATWAAPTINGAAPAAGIVEGYVLQVSTSSTFSPSFTSFPVVGYASTSQAVTGLSNGTNYYLRLRAEKASVTDQGYYTPTLATHIIGTDAKLAALQPSPGALSPVLAPATLAYTVYVAPGTTTFTLTPTASNSYTAITVNGAPVANGTASAALAVGSTTTLVLTSEDLQTTTTYTVQTAVVPGYFRSVASGNWGDASTWQSSYDNTTWTVAPVPPITEFLPTATVRSGHTVTVAAGLSIKTATIENGGIVNTVAAQVLTVPSGATLTVASGGVLSIGKLSSVTFGTSDNTGIISVASGGTLTANGTVVLNTNGNTAFAAGAVSFGAGSRMVLYTTASTLTIPAATWDAAATLELAGTANNTTVAASLAGKTLGSLEVNLTGSGLHVLLTNTGTATLTGNLTVTSTGGGTLRLLAAAATSGGALTINGNYVQNGGLVNGCAGAAANLTGATTVAVNVAGNFTVNGGSFTANQGNSTTVSAIRPNPLTIGGNLTVGTLGTFSLVSALAASNNTNNVAATAYVTSRVNLLGNFSNAGTFTTGSTVTTNTGQQLYFAKAGTQTFANTGTIGSGTNRVHATVNNGSTLDMGTNAFTGIGTFTTVAGATLRLGDPAGVSTGTGATGNVQNTGTRSFAAGTSYVFSGTVAQTLGSTFPMASLTSATSRLVFDNPAGVTLTAPVSTLTGTLQIKQGVVTTNATNLLTLGTSTGLTGTLDATATNTGSVSGPFKRWLAATTGSRDFPVSTGAVLRPASINYTTAPTAGGTLMAEFIATDAGSNGLPLTEGSITINKGAETGFWRVTAANGLAGGSYTPTFTFTGLGGLISTNYTGLVLLKRPDSASPWVLDGTHVATSGSNTAPVLSRTGLTGFSEFTAGGDGAGTLPVQLTAFTAERQGADARLHWTTASEKNSAYFEVQASADGETWKPAGQVPAAGASNAPLRYAFTVPGLNGRRYFRLRQVDRDGNAAYSPVRALDFATQPAFGLSLYPNPAREAVTVAGLAAAAAVEVLDGLGRRVTTATATADGSVRLALPAGLPPGVYVVRGGGQARRLTVE